MASLRRMSMGLASIPVSSHPLALWELLAVEIRVMVGSVLRSLVGWLFSAAISFVREVGLRPSERSGPVLNVLAMVLTGTAGTALALAPSGAQPEVVGFLRLAIGGPILLAAAAMGGKLQRMPVRPALLAAISIGAYQPFFFNAVDRTGVAVATIVALGSAPASQEPWFWLLAAVPLTGAGPLPP